MTVFVRKIVTSNWLDVAQIRIRVTRNVVNFQGHVEKLNAQPKDKEGNEMDLRRIDDEIRALKGFRGVAYFFDNWQRDPVGAWRYTGKKKPEDRR
jgi:hypothetical protein